MGLQVGLVGLPNVGKSTLFNALSQAGAEAENFPFCTIEPNVGIAPVPDERLDRLAALAGSAEAVPTAIEFVDIAGLVAGASEGEGLGNQFLGHVSEVDAICHVVRCFEDDEVAHVHGEVDPARDIEVISTELILRDLETVQRRLERAERAAKSGEKQDVAEVELLRGLYEHLSGGAPARTFGHAPTGPETDGPAVDHAGELAAELRRQLFLLTDKPVLYAANVADDQLPDGGAQAGVVRRIADDQDAEVVVVSAQIEAELALLDDDERREYLAALGLERSGLQRLVSAAYDLLGLITFFTANERQARAWTVPRGSLAPRAAREVHSDMQQGFVRAEVLSFEDFDELGSRAAAREEGRLRLEGKDYEVRDGDVIHVRFAV